MLGAFQPADSFILWMVLIASFLALGCFTWFSWRMTWKKIDVSPYTGLPLRYARDIGYHRAEQIYRFLHDLHQYDNRLFDLKKASFCRETGRIFPESVTFFDSIRVDWNFLQKRLRGDYVSWGSLTTEQQMAIRKQHYSLEGFQTDSSSSIALPRMVEPEFAYAKPGPLYVDISTGTLLGWKQVPGTDFEVLIVQKPQKIIYQKTE